MANRATKQSLRHKRKILHKIRIFGLCFKCVGSKTYETVKPMLQLFTQISNSQSNKLISLKYPRNQMTQRAVRATRHQHYWVTRPKAFICIMFDGRYRPHLCFTYNTYTELIFLLLVFCRF